MGDYPAGSWLLDRLAGEARLAVNTLNNAVARRCEVADTPTAVRNFAPGVLSMP
nr:hypothetical protein [Nocardia donostiensis]